MGRKQERKEGKKGELEEKPKEGRKVQNTKKEERKGERHEMGRER